MQVARVGFTPLKGGRHRTHRSVELTSEGPVGDRAFCLVDAATRRCLRTVENPTLLQAAVSWDGHVLSVELPAGRTVGEPEPSGERLEVDYWGREATVQVVSGPWAAAYSAHLGREVVLAAAAPGDVVYGAPVSLVTNASLARLSEEAGAAVDGVRFRATFQLHGEDLTAHAEDAWVGRRLRLGTAEVEVRGVIPRCAVIDLDPASGVRDLALLKTLGSYRRDTRLGFGVDAVVTVPGQVSAGDEGVLVAG